MNASNVLDNAFLINLLFGVVLTGVGWWVKNIWAMVIEQQKMIAALQVELAKNYVPRVELQDTFKRIFEKLDELLKLEADRNR